MPIWKVISGGYLRFTKSETLYIYPSYHQANALENYLKENFDIELSDVTLIEVIESWSDNKLTIRTKNNDLLERMYGENAVPDALNFYQYKFNEMEQHDPIENNVVLIIKYGCTY